MSVPEDMEELLLKVKALVARHCVLLLAEKDTVGLGYTMSSVVVESLQPEAEVATSLMV